MSAGNWGLLRQDRVGIMLHYDGSVSDAGAVEWLTRDPRCRVSYNWLVLDDGKLVEIAPDHARAWHAGVCRPSNGALLPYRDANSAFYGIALATGAGAPATPAAFATIIRLCRALYRQNGWLDSETWRIVGHNTEAWPRGRKPDPVGPDPKHPVLDVLGIRKELAW